MSANDAPRTHREIFFDSDRRVGKGIATYGEFDQSTFEGLETIDDVSTDPGAMDVLVDDGRTYTEIARSMVAMESQAAHGVALDAVVTSPLAITTFLASQHVMDVVYSSEKNTNRLLSRATTFTPTEDDWTETSNGWNGPDGEVEVRYGSDLSDGEGWGADGGFDDTPSEAESVVGFSPQGSNQGRRTLGFDVDLTEVDDVEFMYMHQNGFENRPQEIIIDDDVVFNNVADEDWTEGSVGLGDYSGEVTFEFGFGDGLDMDDASRWCGFTAFEFN